MASKIPGWFVKWRNHAQAVAAYIIGLAWALAGTGKLVSLITPQVPELSSWVSEFPSILVVGVSIAEILAAVLIFAGRFLSGLVVGLGLLLSFAAALWIYPPQPLQTCGCFGSLPTPDWLSPAGRISLFGGIHAILIAWIRPLKRQV